MNSILESAKHITAKHNVSIRVIDPRNGKVKSVHTGHNAATNTLLTGIAHYLTGDGVLNQGYHMLGNFVPKYISLGTMGLFNQDEDSDGYPAGIGNGPGPEDERFVTYMNEVPGFGADGYDPNENNNRPYLGLGPMFEDRTAIDTPVETLLIGDLNFDGKINLEDLMILVDYCCKAITLTPKQLLVADINKDGKVDCEDTQALKNYIENTSPDKPTNLGTIEYTPTTLPTINCELISTNYPRSKITFRDIVPELEAELPQTVDVVFSAMVSLAALKQFRDSDNDYIFITEAGLWCKPTWEDGSDNGLLAGYRIVPPNQDNWAMSADVVTDNRAVEYLLEQGIVNPTSQQIQDIKPTIAEENRKILKQQIIRVGKNEVVQIIWKIQLGGLDQLDWNASQGPNFQSKLYWKVWGTLL